MRKNANFKDLEKVANRRFHPSVTARERAIFEGAITLGALYHQFLGIPVIREPKLLRLLERTIAETMSLQPYKERVKIRIRDSEVKGRGENPFDYSELNARMLEAEVVSTFGGYRATLAMRYVPELKYSLMYVEHVERINARSK